MRPSLSVPAHTHAHMDEWMKTHKSVMLSQDDLSVRRFPHTACPVACLIRAQHVCG